MCSVNILYRIKILSNNYLIFFESLPFAKEYAKYALSDVIITDRLDLNIISIPILLVKKPTTTEK